MREGRKESNRSSKQEPDGPRRVTCDHNCTSTHRARHTAYLAEDGPQSRLLGDLKNDHSKVTEDSSEPAGLSQANSRCGDHGRARNREASLPGTRGDGISLLGSNERRGYQQTGSSSKHLKQIRPKVVSEAEQSSGSHETWHPPGTWCGSVRTAASRPDKRVKCNDCPVRDSYLWGCSRPRDPSMVGASLVRESSTEMGHRGTTARSQERNREVGRNRRPNLQPAVLAPGSVA